MYNVKKVNKIKYQKLVKIKKNIKNKYKNILKKLLINNNYLLNHNRVEKNL